MNNIRQDFCEIFKKTRQVLLSDIIADIDANAEELENLSDSMKEWITLIDNLSIECKTKSSELQDEINFNNAINDDYCQNINKTDEVDNQSNEKSNFKFISSNSGIGSRNLSWVDLNEIEENHEKHVDLCTNIIEKLSNPITNIKEISILNNINIGTLKVPIVNKMENIQPAINYFTGDKTYKAGLYMSLNQCYVEIPFPDTIDGTKNSNRTSSVKCKYGSLENCKLTRESLASKYNSEIRKCNFAHIGDHYIKIGTSFRCPGAPSFGAHHDLKTDMQKVDINDIKMLLMYATSDLLLTNIWLQKYQPNIILTELDICH